MNLSTTVLKLLLHPCQHHTLHYMPFPKIQSMPCNWCNFTKLPIFPETFQKLSWKLSKFKTSGNSPTLHSTNFVFLVIILNAKTPIKLTEQRIPKHKHFLLTFRLHPSDLHRKVSRVSPVIGKRFNCPALNGTGSLISGCARSTTCNSMHRRYTDSTAVDGCVGELNCMQQWKHFECSLVP